MQRTVLVVDDDETTRFVLASALRDLGCEVVTAEDGAEVDDLLAQQRFDLIVLDLHMPGMNGFEVLRQLRQSLGRKAAACSGTVPVVVVSGETYPASIAHARRLGASAYLGKPVDLGLLEDTARQLLGM